MLLLNSLRGISSVGRAPALHVGCRKFESCILHHKRPIHYESVFYYANTPCSSGVSSLSNSGILISYLKNTYFSAKVYLAQISKGVYSDCNKGSNSSAKSNAHCFHSAKFSF